MNEIPKQLVELYNNNPVVNNALHYYLFGEYSLENALIACVVVLANQNDELCSKITTMISNNAISGVLLED